MRITLDDRIAADFKICEDGYIFSSNVLNPCQAVLMFVRHDELVWMLRLLYGRRFRHEDLRRKFSSHGITSLLPYVPAIDALFQRQADHSAIVTKTLRLAGAMINCAIDRDLPAAAEATYRDLHNLLLPRLQQVLNEERTSPLQIGARVSVRLNSISSQVRPGSQGFITEKQEASSTVRFYTTPGIYNAEVVTRTLPDSELQTLPPETLLARHRNIDSLARYFFHDALLRSMKTGLDPTVYASAADLAVRFLLDEGFLKIDGNEYVGVLDRIFPVLAPACDRAYKDTTLFSSPTLSCPPSEKKAHVLRLELTTGCDYNKCTFCSEYKEMPATTKSFAEFKDHVDRVTAAIGGEKERIQRLFIGSGNSLGVNTPLLLQALRYVGNVFAPQRISLYGRTHSILEKSDDELKQLREAGLSLIYWGLESGSDEVLRYICKECTRADMIAASKKLAAAGIEVSAMLMPGTGGRKFSQQHVAGTLELLHSIDIKYLTLLSINPAETSVYAQKMATEKDNRHLTADEVNAQVYHLLQGLKPSDLHIGMFTDEIDQASSNTRRINCQFTEANKEFLLREF